MAAVSQAPPDSIASTEQLEDLLSEPSPDLVERMGRIEGDVIVLGASGKMGPTLARMARRASEQAGVGRRVIGVARFSNPAEQGKLEAWGLETVRCDLLDASQLTGLPDAANVIYLAGVKFGATGNEALTWAVNTHLPGLICRRYRHSRIVAFSTGNVYPLSPVALGGSVESDPLNPVGEYAMSCVGRERIFEHFSRTLGTAVVLLRLNYACELRYGVLVDLAERVRAGEAIDLTMGNVNVIWQADASAMALAALEHAASPPFVLNVAGPEILSVRRVCLQFADLMGCAVRFEGQEADAALLSNGQLGHRLFGYPRVSVGRLIRWVADWVQKGGARLGKPTHFEVRDGRF